MTARMPASTCSGSSRWVAPEPPSATDRLRLDCLIGGLVGAPFFRRRRRAPSAWLARRIDSLNFSLAWSTRPECVGPKGGSIS
eukprot:2725055-Prymnesium_polylepis.2